MRELKNPSKVRRPVSSLKIALGYGKYTHIVGKFTLYKILLKTFFPKVKSRQDIREELIFGVVYPHKKKRCTSRPILATP